MLYPPDLFSWPKFCLFLYYFGHHLQLHFVNKISQLKLAQVKQYWCFISGAFLTSAPSRVSNQVMKLRLVWEYWVPCQHEIAAKFSIIVSILIPHARLQLSSFYIYNFWYYNVLIQESSFLKLCYHAVMSGNYFWCPTSAEFDSSLALLGNMF